MKRSILHIQWNI